MDWQKYLPWIIGGVVLLYVLTKFRQKTLLAPQTQITQTPQIDPYLEARSKAFDSLVALAGIEAAQDTEKFKSTVGLTVANKSYDTQVTIAQILANAETYAANLNLFQRNQDRMIQQSAIDRYYSSRNTQAILGSVNQALSNVFGNRGNSNIVFGTPKTFPDYGFSF